MDERGFGKCVYAVWISVDVGNSCKVCNMDERGCGKFYVQNAAWKIVDVGKSSIMYG